MIDEIIKCEITPLIFCKLDEQISERLSHLIWIGCSIRPAVITHNFDEIRIGQQAREFFTKISPHRVPWDIEAVAGVLMTSMGRDV